MRHIVVAALLIGCGSREHADPSPPKANVRVETIAADEEVPTAIAIDRERVYWIAKNEIVAAALDGGARASLARVEGTIGTLVVRDGFAHAKTPKGIARVAIGGGEVQTVVEDPAVITFTVDGNDIVWLSKTAKGPSRGALRRRPIAGGDTTVIAQTTGVSAAGLAIVGERIYFATTGSLDEGLVGAVHFVSRDGGEPQELARFEYPIAMLAVGADAVFVSVPASMWKIPPPADSDKIYRVPLTGGAPTVVIAMQLLGPRIAVDGNRLAFVERRAPPGKSLNEAFVVPFMPSIVAIIDLTTGKRTDMATDEPGTAGLAFAAAEGKLGRLVWANTGPVDGKGGSIRARRLTN